MGLQEHHVGRIRVLGHADGNLTGVAPFVEQGAEGLAVDAAGNVYLAAGRLFVYSPAGRLLDTIDVPERPTEVVFGGKDGRTRFITARGSLYSVPARVAGR